MVKRIGFLALGGHTANQNATFRAIMEILGNAWEFYGLENGFKAFDTGNQYLLSVDLLGKYYAGFYAGATRATLLGDDGNPDPEKIAKAIKFVKAAKLNYLVASAGDDHGKQMDILRKAFEDEGINCKVLVINKTMDGDKGGIDGIVEEGYIAPFADTTNGFHTAIDVGTRMIHQHHSGSWTNETVTIVSHFGRYSNWVALGLSWYGNCDRIFPGELPSEHPGHSIEKIVELTTQSMDENKKTYGRRFAVIDFPEGTKIQGIEHVSKTMKDVHKHKRLSPEILAVALQEALADKRYSIKSQTAIIMYEMRNFPPSETDLKLAKISGIEIAKAIESGISGMEVVIKFKNGNVVTELCPLHLASQQRLAKYYPKPLYDAKTFRPLFEIECYFRPLLGERVDREILLPKKPKVVNVYNPIS